MSKVAQVGRIDPERDAAERSVSQLKDQILELLGREAALAETANAICLAYEQLQSGTHCSILILEGQRLRVVAGPTLPDAYNAAIDGIRIGPSVGSCGTAAYLGTQIIAEDIDTDPRWDAYRETANAAGLKACWSTPLFNAAHEVVATFAIYYSRPNRPSLRDLQTVKQFAWLATIAVERHLTDKRLGEALAAAHAASIKEAQLQAATEAKSAFLAHISHELRTPLNVISNYTTLLRDQLEETGPTELLEDVGKIEIASRHLVSVINQVLDLAKIEAGRLELTPETFEIAPFLKDLSALVSPLAEANRDRLTIACPPDPGRIHADPLRLRQALINLLGNACKFTKDGAVTLTVDATTDEVAFRVADTGIGMNADQLARIFQPFAQADSTIARTYGGTGIGLVLAKRFAEMMGGTLTVTSAPGAGSTFLMTLPRAA